MPAFGLQGDETVQQMMNRINAATPRAAEGCLSFGMAVSDFVFGEQAPVTQRWEGFILRVGDMIHIKAEGTERVLILTGVDYEKDAYTACGLKRNGKVKWSDGGPVSGLVDGFGFTTVYKRW